VAWLHNTSDRLVVRHVSGCDRQSHLQHPNVVRCAPTGSGLATGMIDFCELKLNRLVASMSRAEDVAKAALGLVALHSKELDDERSNDEE
jgi:hypothetical protein